MTSRTLIPDAPLLDEQGNVTTPWLQVLKLWGVTITAQRQAGPTSQRPTSGLWVSRQYYDTTIGKPIWVYQVEPAVVWADANGLTV